MVIDVTSAWAAEETAPAVVLTKDGGKLRTHYSDLLSTLQTEITKALPAVPEHKKAAFQADREAVRKARADVNVAQQPLTRSKVQSPGGAHEVAEVRDSARAQDTPT